VQLVAFSQVVQPSKVHTGVLASHVADDPLPDWVKPDAGQTQVKSEPLCVLTKLAAQVVQLVAFSQVVQPSKVHTGVLASHVADDPLPDWVKPDAGQTQVKSEPLCVLTKLAAQVVQLVAFSQVVQPSKVHTGVLASHVADDPLPDWVKPDAGQTQVKSEPLCVLTKLAAQVVQLVAFSQVVQPSKVHTGVLASHVADDPLPDWVKPDAGQTQVKSEPLCVLTKLAAQVVQLVAFSQVVQPSKVHTGVLASHVADDPLPDWVKPDAGQTQVKSEPLCVLTKLAAQVVQLVAFSQVVQPSKVHTGVLASHVADDPLPDWVKPDAGQTQVKSEPLCVLTKLAAQVVQLVAFSQVVQPSKVHTGVLASHVADDPLPDWVKPDAGQTQVKSEPLCVLTKLAAQVVQLVAFSQVVQPSKVHTGVLASHVADDPLPDWVKPDAGQTQVKSEPLCVLTKLAAQVVQLVAFSQVVQPSKVHTGVLASHVADDPLPDWVKPDAGQTQVKSEPLCVLTKLAAQVVQLVAFSQVVQPSKVHTGVLASHVADDPLPDWVKPDAGQTQVKSEPLCVLTKLAAQVVQLVAFSQVVQPSKVHTGVLASHVADDPLPDWVKPDAGQTQVKSEPLCVLTKLAAQVVQLVAFSQVVQPSKVHTGVLASHVADDPLPDWVKPDAGQTQVKSEPVCVFLRS
jgi:lipoate synthase